jgi:hypothetical protein
VGKCKNKDEIDIRDGYLSTEGYGLKRQHNAV